MFPAITLAPSIDRLLLLSAEPASNPALALRCTLGNILVELIDGIVQGDAGFPAGIFELLLRVGSVFSQLSLSLLSLRPGVGHLEAY